MVDAPLTSQRSRITIPANLAKYYSQPNDVVAISDSSKVVIRPVRYFPSYVRKNLSGDHRSRYLRLPPHVVINRADVSELPTWRDDAVAGTRLG